MSEVLRIGCGAGFAGDRFDAAVPIVASLAQHTGPRFLIFETLAERTLALAQRLRLDDPDLGYSPYLERYVAPILKDAHQAGIRIVSNFGAAHPMAAGKRILEIAEELGIDGLKVGVVEGDSLRDTIADAEILALELMDGALPPDGGLIAANAYLGGAPIAAALDRGADVVVTGRCADPALVVGPAMHTFGWRAGEDDRIAAATLAGHLIECGAQVTGAYFADPGYKDVPDLARVGFPIAEIDADGAVTITKPAGTGGAVSAQTVKEQLLYEVHDPAAYLTPDVTLDMTGLRIEETGENRVTISGARGHAAPENLKATLSFEGGWLGEGEISYAGPNALARAQLAVEVLRERCTMQGLNTPVRLDIIGATSVLDGDGAGLRAGRSFAPDGDYRVRAAVSSAARAVAQQVTDEVLSLYCSGPAGGAGVRQSVTQRISTASVLTPRHLAEPRVTILEAGA